MKVIARVAILAAVTLPATARADSVTSWMATSSEAVASSYRIRPTLDLPKLEASPLTALAIFEAVNTLDHRYRDHGPRLPVPSGGASADAAVAMAAFTVLSTELPDQSPLLRKRLEEALDQIPDAGARAEGLSVGRAAAAYALSQGGMDSAIHISPYRPVTAPGRWVPTALPKCNGWMAGVRPLALSALAAVRAPRPIGLKTARWASDYKEVHDLGAKDSNLRTSHQREIALAFDDMDTEKLLRSVADAPGRTLAQNAHFYAVAMTALLDASLTACDGKMTYEFWRPITAIRNGDRDGNVLTVRDAGWEPLIQTPNHPEYPCAHCVTAGVLAEVLEGEVTGPIAIPSLSVPGSRLVMENLGALSEQMSLSRIYAGLHYRFSVQVGQRLGRGVGAAARERLAALSPGRPSLPGAR